MTRLRKYGWITALACVAGGCTAFELRDANQQLSSHYFAKQQASAGEGDWRMLEASLSALQTLARDAAAQARKEGDVLNRIAFYRIAVTAAWQAGDADVVAYGEEGQRLCAGENFARAPRDCGMLLVIPEFAAVDETTDQFDELVARLRGPGGDPTPGDAETAEQIYVQYGNALDSLLSQRERIRGSRASPGFIAAVDQNIALLYCGHLKVNAFGLLALVDPDRLDAERQALSELDCRLLGAGFTPQTANCLPAACD